MNFVKSLSMFHVDAKEIPCLTAKGAPTEQTEGAPGVLYMDTDTGELYKCTAADYVNKVFTWKLLVEGNGSSESSENIEVSRFVSTNGTSGATISIIRESEDGTVDAQTANVYDGKSAYKYAQDAGYTGTEAEFAEKMASSDSSQNVTVDIEMSDTSENPVQNKVIKAYVDATVSNGGSTTLDVDFVQRNKFRLHQLGELYTPPSRYVAWGGSMLYEKRLGKFVQWLYCAPAHAHSTAELYVVYIDKKTMVADEPVHCVYYDTDGSTALSFDNECGITVRPLVDGSYEAIKAVKEGNATTLYRFNSVDYGKTWIKGASIRCPSSGFDTIVELSNGRYITSYGGPMFYSDDQGANWTTVAPATAGGDYEAEAYFCELKPGTVMAIARYSVGGGTSGDGTPDPAVIAYSYDYGTTWTPWKKSTSILDMNAIGCSGIMHDGFVELFVMSRWYEGIDAHTETGKCGAVYQYTASVDDALNDDFTNNGIVYYSKAAYAQDFTSPDLAVDDDGDMLFSVADGDESVVDVCAKVYAKGTKTSYYSLVDDKNLAPFRVFSNEKVAKLLNDMNEKILTLEYALSQIDGSGVPTPEVPEDTVMWTKTWDVSSGSFADSVFAEYLVDRVSYQSWKIVDKQDSLGNNVQSVTDGYLNIPATKDNYALEITDTWEDKYSLANDLACVINDELDEYRLITSDVCGFADGEHKWLEGIKLFVFSEPVKLTRRFIKRGNAVTFTLRVNDEVVVENFDVTQQHLWSNPDGITLGQGSVTQKGFYENGANNMHSLKFGEWD